MSKKKSNNKSKSKSKSMAKIKSQAASQAKSAASAKAKNPDGSKGAAASAQPNKGKSPAAKKRIAIIVGAVVAVVAIVAIIVFAVLGAGKSSLLQPKGYNTDSLKVYSEAESSDGGRTVTYNGATYKLNESVVPICIMGQDKGLHTPDEGTNGQADAVMVIAVNTETNDIKGIAVPRDSMVSSLKKFRDVYKNSSYKTDKMQLCLTYACGNNDKQSSEYVESAVSKDLLFGIPINWYYTLDTNGLGELADLAGGVTLEALYTIPVTQYSSDMPIEAGQTVTLTGGDALRYVQYRDTSRYQTALERLERQQQFVKALGKKLLEQVKGNPSKVTDIFSTLQKYSVTNLGTSELGYLASLAASASVDELAITRLQGEAVHNSDNPWEQFFVDEASTYQSVLDTFYTKVS